MFERGPHQCQAFAWVFVGNAEHQQTNHSFLKFIKSNTKITGVRRRAMGQSGTPANRPSCFSKPFFTPCYGPVGTPTIARQRCRHVFCGRFVTCKRGGAWRGVWLAVCVCGAWCVWCVVFGAWCGGWCAVCGAWCVVCGVRRAACDASRGASPCCCVVYFVALCFVAPRCVV